MCFFKTFFYFFIFITLIGVTIQKVPESTVLPFSPQANVRGTLAGDTRTIDEVTEQPIDDTGVAL